MKQVIAAMSLALLSSIAFSQASAPESKAKGESAKPAASAPAPQPGAGPGARGPRGRMMRFDEKNTPGWSLMTSEERLAHRDRMHAFKTTDECKAYHDEHLKQMEARAKEQGKSFKRFRGDPCGMMQQRGFLK